MNQKPNLRVEECISQGAKGFASGGLSFLICRVGVVISDRWGFDANLMRYSLGGAQLCSRHTVGIHKGSIGGRRRALTNWGFDGGSSCFWLQVPRHPSPLPRVIPMGS